MSDSVRLRLRADVPGGAYLSGGLDSSLISALAQIEKGGELRTFSIAFKDPRYDERAHQEAVARELGTQHHVVEAGPADIARALPAVLRHTETPLVRTAPVPLYLLAEQVRANDLTVVITGEGADELFWGYDLFKEVVVRELNRHDPERARALLEEFYPYLGDGGARRGPAFTRFLLETGSPDDPLGSHLTRAEATATVKAFYRPEVAAEVGRDGLARAASRRAAAGVRRLEHARAGSLARGVHAARAVPPGCAGRPRGDGPWGGGAVPVSRPPRLRVFGRAARRSASSTGCATRSRFASWHPTCSPRTSWSARSSPTVRRRSSRSSARRSRVG